MPPRQWFRRHLPLERETCVFILACTLDIVMTWILLYRGGYRESNPIARYFLDHWGIKGMVYYKFASVIFVCLIAQWIAARREPAARFLLNVGTLIVISVVIYSFALYLRHGHAPPPDEAFPIGFD